MTIAQQILNGQLHSEIEDIIAALKVRRKHQRQIAVQSNMMTIKVGDPVTLKGLTPKKLNGRTGILKEKKRTRVIVKLTDGVNDHRNPTNSTVNIPAVCIEMS